MEDQLISFETAKLAKEKEFCWENNDKLYYNSNGYLNILNFSEEDIPAPTQSLLQKWLREVHGYHIDIHRVGNKYRVNIECMITANSYWSDDIDYETYEEALEVGSKEALGLIPQAKLKF